MARFKGAPMGENLFMAHGFKPPAEDAVKDWYSEIKFYNFKKGTGKDIGHFTQVVWKDTKYIGEFKDGKCHGYGVYFYDNGGYKYTKQNEDSVEFYKRYNPNGNIESCIYY